MTYTAVTAEPFDPLPWLAPRLLDAYDLLMVHHGDLEGARSQITASACGEFTDDGEHQVWGRKVTYGHAGHEGEVPIMAVLRHAAACHDPVVGERLDAAYGRYVDASVARRGARPASRVRADAELGVADRHLRACAAAWWTDET